MKRSLAISFTILVAVIGALFAANTSGQPQTPIVGYQRLSVPLPNRATDVTVHLWYPAKPRSPVSKVGQSLLFWGFDSARDAEALGQQLPVLLMSHGSGGNALRHAWIATRFADEGFIVVAPDHPGSTSGDSDPATTLQLHLRPQDLSGLIDWLAQTPPAGLNPDLSRIGVVGFSMGGFSALATAGLRASKQRFVDYCDTNRGKLDCGWYQAAGVDLTSLPQTAFNASNLDRRIRAVAAIDPALTQAFQSESAENIAVPTLILNLGSPDTMPPVMDAAALAAAISDANHAYIKGASHFSFMDECRLIGSLVLGLASPDALCAGSKRRAALHADIAPRLIDFLKANL